MNKPIFNVNVVATDGSERKQFNPYANILMFDMDKGKEHILIVIEDGNGDKTYHWYSPCNNCVHAGMGGYKSEASAIASAIIHADIVGEGFEFWYKDQEHLTSWVHVDIDVVDTERGENTNLHLALSKRQPISNTK